MANLPLTPTWEPGVYQLEVTDPVLGGAGGIDNLQPTQLGNRTEFLKTALDRLSAGDQVTIANQGIQSGCQVTVSATERRLNVAFGRIFRLGSTEIIWAQPDAVIVPDNPAAEQKTAEGYFNGDGVFLLAPFNTPAPAGTLTAIVITVPANNTLITDPDLSECTLEEVARREPGWPTVVAEPAQATVDVANWEDYQVYLDLIDWTGPRPQVEVGERAADHFTILALGEADAVHVRVFQVKV